MNLNKLLQKLHHLQVIFSTQQTQLLWLQKKVLKEIETVVKDFNGVSANSETLLNYIENILDSLGTLNQNAVKQGDIIEKLHIIDEENKNISNSLAQIMSANSEKLAKLNNLSNEIKNSAIEG